jgi:hypothetical protein
MNVKIVYLYCIVGKYKEMDVNNLETIDFISIGHVDQRNNLNSPYVVNHP